MKVNEEFRMYLHNSMDKDNILNSSHTQTKDPNIDIYLHS